MNGTIRVLGFALVIAFAGAALANTDRSSVDSAQVDSGIAQATTQPTSQPAAAPEISRAVAVLHPTEGNDVSGTVTFTENEGSITVTASVSGLTPGNHGFHIHQYGDCTAPDGTSAGGHFNPHGMSHGGPQADPRHVGDMGNLTADDAGNAFLEYTDSTISFEGENSILGRGVIVHANEDDLTTQPTGAAGARVACGVIGVSSAE